MAATILGSMTMSAFGQDSPAGEIKMLVGDQAMSWQTDVDGITTWSDDGYSFSGTETGDGWIIQWDILSSGSGTRNMVVQYTVINTSSSTQNFQIAMTEGLGAPFNSGTLTGGSVAGTFTDLNGDGVEVSARDDASIYSAYLDRTDTSSGIVVGTLLDESNASASSFMSGIFANESFGDIPEVPSHEGPAALESFGILLDFELTAGDAAGFTGTMAVAAPAPGALALLGFAGLQQRRRRSA